MWKRKRKAEWLPWYRARNYKGDLTEAEKRQLCISDAAEAPCGAER
jgi:exonuclease I